MSEGEIVLTVYARRGVGLGEGPPWRYEEIDTASPAGTIRVRQAPAVGDYTPWGRVVARQWLTGCVLVVDPEQGGPFLDEVQEVDG